MKGLRIFVIIGLLFLPPFLYGASESYNFETIVASNTAAIGLSTSKTAMPSNSAPPCGALLTVETNNIRFRTDGTAATNSIGHQVVAGDSFVVDSQHDLQTLSMIGVSSTGTVHVTYWRGCR